MIQKRIIPPYSFLVSDSRQRRSPYGCFVSRLVPDLPEKSSVYRVIDPKLRSAPFDLYIVSPELSFVQMANRFSLVETIGYGFELCGTYTPSECAKEEPAQLMRLSSAQRLDAYCKRVPGMHGVVRARKAVGAVLDNSHSIKETELAMMLSLSKRMHGFATPRPTLNYPIKVQGKRESFMSQIDYEIDLCWPDCFVGIEVDSKKYHKGEMKLVKDARRRNTLQYLGYTIIQATQGDLGSATGIAGLGKQLYEAMGIRSRKGQFDVDEERLELYREVFNLSNYP